MLGEYALTTYERMKTRLKLEDDALEENVVEAINVASAVIESFCRRKFGKRTYTDLILEDGDEHIFEHYPLLEVIDIDQKPFAVEPLYTESGVMYEKVRSRSRIRYEAGFVLPSDASEDNPQTLPHDVEHACQSLVAYLYDDGEGSERDLSSELKSFDLGDFKAVLGSGGSANHLIPADVQSVLLPYRKVRIG